MKYNAVTVTQLNKYIKERFDEDENLNAILVKGEISNFKNHYTGHLYFTLKDENSLIKCIMFKSYAEKLAFKPTDGMKVMVFGSVSVFERDGTFLYKRRSRKIWSSRNSFCVTSFLLNSLKKKGFPSFSMNESSKTSIENFFKLGYG